MIKHLNIGYYFLGTIFLPDSIGYVVGTNTFGLIAYRFGRYVENIDKDLINSAVYTHKKYVILLSLSDGF